jgi:hypothetical protein
MFPMEVPLQNVIPEVGCHACFVQVGCRFMATEAELEGKWSILTIAWNCHAFSKPVTVLVIT